MCATGVLSLVQPFPVTVGSWEFGRFDVDFATELVNLDLKTSIARHENYEGFRHRLDGMSDAAKEALTRKLRNINAGAGPVLRDAAYRNEIDLVKHVFNQCPDLFVRSSNLRGPLGETPHHIAASAGSIETMKILLREGSDVNAVDFDGETPLHIAALAGNKESVHYLLSNHADSELESYFSETAIEVAMQQPAFFLNRAHEAADRRPDYEEVINLLTVFTERRKEGKIQP